MFTPVYLSKGGKVMSNYGNNFKGEIIDILPNDSEEKYSYKIRILDGEVLISTDAVGKLLYESMLRKIGTSYAYNGDEKNLFDFKIQPRFNVRDIVEW
jgi:hypothetical protein